MTYEQFLKQLRRIGKIITPMEMVQFVAAKEQVIPVLARLDEGNPGLMPVPHDGVGWKNRAKFGGEE